MEIETKISNSVMKLFRRVILREMIVRVISEGYKNVIYDTNIFSSKLSLFDNLISSDMKNLDLFDWATGDELKKSTLNELKSSICKDQEQVGGKQEVCEYRIISSGLILVMGLHKYWVMVEKPFEERKKYIYFVLASDAILFSFFYILGIINFNIFALIVLNSLLQIISYHMKHIELISDLCYRSISIATLTQTFFIPLHIFFSY